MIEGDEKRMMDLIQYQRAELHKADLITDEEYMELCKIDGAVGRLEGYDDMRDRAEKAEKALAAIVQYCEGDIACNHADIRHIARVGKGKE